MEIQNSEQLVTKKCVPCEGGVEPCTVDFSNQQLAKLNGWKLTDDNQRIRKEWTVENFLAGLAFFEKVGAVAEAEAHHPDLHLVCLLYTSPSPRDRQKSRMPSSA